MVNVKQIAEMGAYVKLLEYGGCRHKAQECAMD
jgi:translation initiation factor 2 alpha subunit (eIF-2alpha)